MTFQGLDDIARAQVPLVLPDTCILLDILRSPRRDDVDARSVESAKAITDAVNGGSVASVIAGQVHHELDENRISVQKKTEEGLRDLQSEQQRIDGWSDVLGVSGKADISHAMSAVSRCAPILDDWIASSLSFPATNELAGRAHRRMMDKITPARQRKDSFKDCLVVETYLEVARALRSRDYSGKIVFASSNTKDFTDPPTHRNLRSDLAQEFEAVGIEYARNLPEIAYLRLRLRP